MSIVVLPDPNVPFESVRAWAESLPMGTRVLSAWDSEHELDVHLSEADRQAAIAGFRQACDAWNQMPVPVWRGRFRRQYVEILPGRLLARSVRLWSSYCWVLWSLETISADLEAARISEVQVFTDDETLTNIVSEWLDIRGLSVEVVKIEAKMTPPETSPIQVGALAKSFLNLLGDIVLRRGGILILDQRNTRAVTERIPRKYHLSSQSFMAAVLLLTRFRRRRSAKVASPLELVEFAGSDSAQVALRGVLDRFKQNELRTFSAVSAVLSVANLLRPRFILSYDWEGPVSHSLRAWSQRNNHAFAVVQHGFSIGNSWSVFCPDVDADIFYNWGEMFQGARSSRQDQKTVFLPFGNPCYQAKKEESVVDTKVLVAPSAFLPLFDDAWSRLWAEIVELPMVPELNRIDWHIRLHTLSRQRSLIEKMALNVGMQVSMEHDFMDAIAGSLAVITTPSSVVIDSLFCEVPVVMLNPTGDPHDLAMGCCVVSSFDEIVDALRGLLEVPSMRTSHLEKQAAFLKGVATDGPAEKISLDAQARMKSVGRSPRAPGPELAKFWG